MDDFLWFIIIAAAVVAVIAVVSIFMMNRIANVIINSNFNERFDDRHTLKYFTVDDFENLQAEPLEFDSDEGFKLKGYLYSSTLIKEPKALMVVSHGLGAGHLQYTTEINYFAQQGYLVFAFDDTGCNMSEGDRLKGITQGLIDLNTALKYIDSNEKLNKLPKVLFGHSMGAFSVCNVTSINNTEIKGIVALAPFKDEPSMLYEQFAAITNFRYKLVKKFLTNKYKKRFNEEIMKVNTIDSFEKSDIPHLIIAGDMDNIVDNMANFDEFKARFEDKENYTFLSVPQRYHRPNLTLEAAKYDQDTNEELQRINGEFKGNAPKERIDTFYRELDYDLLTQMDSEVMNVIDSFLNDCLK